MVKPLNKEWELFGRKYRVAGAKGEKVDCRACQKQVSAAVNRLQSHMRVCPARNSPGLLNSGSNAVDAPDSGTGLTDAIAQAIAADSLAPEQASAPEANAVESNVPPAKKQRQSPARAIDRLRWNAAAANAINVDDLWLNSIVTGPATAVNAVQPAAASSFNKRRLEIEEKRLQLEVKRDEREERRERLSLEILEAQARKEKLLAEKEEYGAKVLLALSRKQLRDQGISEDEIDRILPISNTATASSSSCAAAANSSEVAAVTTEDSVASCEKETAVETNDVGKGDADTFQVPQHAAML